MPTIDSKDIIETIIRNDGVYPGDPPVYAIVEYTNRAGRVTWSISYTRPHYVYAVQSTHKPRTIWFDGKWQPESIDGKSIDTYFAKDVRV